MPANDLQGMVNEAVDMLPPKGEKVEFNAYKAKLYAANPDNGQAVFSHMIKREVVNKELGRNEENAIVVLLSRK
jgi:hypothetical protein